MTSDFFIFMFYIMFVFDAMMTNTKMSKTICHLLKILFCKGF